MRLDLVQKCKLFCCRFVISCNFGNFGNSSFQDLKVRKDQLQINGLNVTDWINASVYVDYIGILKAAYYMNDCIDFTDVCKELISKTLSLRSALYKSCNVNKFYNCGNYFCRII